MMDNEIGMSSQDKIKNFNDLNAAIKRLERKKDLLEENIKGDFHTLLENLKPSNILKNTIHEVQEFTDFKKDILKIVLGLGAGYFSRKLIVGKSSGFLKKALGTALQLGITTFISKKKDKEEKQNTNPKRKNLLKKIFSS